MFIPHGRAKVYGLKIPSSFIFLFICLLIGFNIYVLSVAVDSLEYYQMKQKFISVMNRFDELRTTIIS
ncbi:MAG: hypothetical protein N3A00_03890, partial [Thermodesulfovibrio sp.]|nr:hypothetical protein [Thermodesulfovibrio sp.]